MDILTGESCRQFRLVIWNFFNGKFVQPIGRKGMGGIVKLASEFHLIREYENLVNNQVITYPFSATATR